MNAYVDNWNWAAASSLYSQLTGVLAGFAFTAIVLLISNLPKKQQIDDIGKPAYSLLIVFVGLIMASFLFAFLTGYTKNDSTILLMDICGTIASFIFAICMMQMFMSIVFLFKSYNFPTVVLSKGHLAFHGISFLAIFYMISTMAEAKLLLNSQGKTIYLILLPIIIIVFGKLLLKIKCISSYLKNIFYKCISLIFASFIIVGIVFEAISYFEYILSLNQFLFISFILIIIQSLAFLLFDYFLLDNISSSAHKNN